VCDRFRGGGHQATGESDNGQVHHQTYSEQLKPDYVRLTQVKFNLLTCELARVPAAHSLLMVDFCTGKPNVMFWKIRPGEHEKNFYSITWCDCRRMGASAFLLPIPSVATNVSSLSG
jgi:hypothetical protein